MTSFNHKLTPSSAFERGAGWLTAQRHMTRSLSMLRILYGIGLLTILLPSIPERSYLWGPSSWWVDPEAKRRGFVTFDTLLPKDSAFWFDVAFFAFIALTVLFIIGYRTRIVLPILLVFLVALQSNNPFLLNGGDALMRITLAFLLCADLSRHFSLDARRAKTRQGTKETATKLLPPYVSNAAHNLGVLLCGFQIMLVYITSAIWKLSGTDWLDGSALYYALTLHEFQAYPLVNELIWQSSPLIMVATWLSLWVQLMFPLMLLWKPTRIIALVALMLMHMGIGSLMTLWAFSLAMIGLDLLFVRDSSWERLWARVTHVRDSLRLLRVSDPDRLAARGDVQFSVDRTDVGLHRRVGDVELRGDFVGGQGGAEVSEDFAFPGRQHVGG